MSPINLIHLHYLVPLPGFKSRKALKSFLVELLQNEKKEVETINFIFCSDEYLLGLNNQYLKHDTYTDIVTFELSEKRAPLLADIFISVDRVRENAKKFGKTFQEELHRVIFHGILHLCGYGDKKPADKKLMREKENLYLEQYFVSRET